MIIHWIYLLTGLGFGLIPPIRLLNCECRYLQFEELWTGVIRRPMDNTRRKRWWKLPLVWVDPIRGYVVGMMLSKAFSPPARASFIEAQFPVLALLGTLMLVLMVQTQGRSRERESLSPAGFMAGLMLALMPPVVAIGALVVGGSTSIALHRYSFGYWAAAFATASVGFAFMQMNPKLGVFVLMVSAPAWMSWLRGTTLVTPVRC
jgi:hypothetical protein